MYNGKILYRLERTYSWARSIDDLLFTEYGIWKKTAKGQWIVQVFYLDNSFEDSVFKSYCRWMSNKAKVPYAWNTKEEALLSFIKRKQRYIEHLENDITNAKDDLKYAEFVYQKTKEEKENINNEICNVD